LFECDRIDDRGVGDDERRQAEVLFDGVEPVADRGGVGHVRTVVPGATPQRTDLVEQRVGLGAVPHVTDGDVRTAPSEFQGDRLADVAQSAADRRYFARQRRDHHGLS
jgi:hypothetical protein